MAEILAVSGHDTVTDHIHRHSLATANISDELELAVSKVNISLEGEEEELSKELEEILQSCDEMQTKGRKDIDSNSGSAGSVKLFCIDSVCDYIMKSGGATKPEPYQSDLEYLEDNFLLIETKVKVLKIEQSDDSLLFHADQRKPEAVIREMKAKARSLQAKINQRMLATQNAEGKCSIE